MISDTSSCLCIHHKYTSGVGHLAMPTSRVFRSGFNELLRHISLTVLSSNELSAPSWESPPEWHSHERATGHPSSSSNVGMTMWHRRLYEESCFLFQRISTSRRLSCGLVLEELLLLCYKFSKIHFNVLGWPQRSRKFRPTKGCLWWRHLLLLQSRFLIFPRALGALPLPAVPRLQNDLWKPRGFSIKQKEVGWLPCILGSWPDSGKHVDSYASDAPGWQRQESSQIGQQFRWELFIAG